MRSVFQALFLFPFLFFLICPIFAIGQDLDNVTISGKISDSNNLPIADATITAIQTQTGEQRYVITNDDGLFKIIQLKPGIYTITVTQTGFGIQEKTDLVTISGQNIQLDFQLVPADVQVETSVSITEEDAPIIDTTLTIVGGTVTQREIEELPNNTRNPFDLVLTLGGVTEESLSTRDLADDRNSNPRSTPTEQGNFSLSALQTFVFRISDLRISHIFGI